MADIITLSSDEGEGGIEVASSPGEAAAGVTGAQGPAGRGRVKGGGAESEPSGKRSSGNARVGGNAGAWKAAEDGAKGTGLLAHFSATPRAPREKVTCPVCNRTDFSSEREVRLHIDWCLSRQQVCISAN